MAARGTARRGRLVAALALAGAAYEDGRLELHELLERTGAERPRANPDHDPDWPFAGGYAAWGSVTPPREEAAAGR